MEDREDACWADLENDAFTEISAVRRTVQIPTAALDQAGRKSRLNGCAIHRLVKLVDGGCSARVRELEYRPTTCLLANCSVAAVGGYSEQRAIGSGEQCALRQDTVCDIDECVNDAHFAGWRDPVDRSATELAQREIP